MGALTIPGPTPEPGETIPGLVRDEREIYWEDNFNRVLDGEYGAATGRFAIDPNFRIWDPMRIQPVGVLNWEMLTDVNGDRVVVPQLNGTELTFINGEAPPSDAAANVQGLDLKREFLVVIVYRMTGVGPGLDTLDNSVIVGMAERVSGDAGGRFALAYFGDVNEATALPPGTPVDYTHAFITSATSDPDGDGIAHAFLHLVRDSAYELGAGPWIGGLEFVDNHWRVYFPALGEDSLTPTEVRDVSSGITDNPLNAAHPVLALGGNSGGYDHGSLVAVDKLRVFTPLTGPYKGATFGARKRPGSPVVDLKEDIWHGIDLEPNNHDTDHYGEHGIPSYAAATDGSDPSSPTRG